MYFQLLLHCPTVSTPKASVHSSNPPGTGLHAWQTNRALTQTRYPAYACLSCFFCMNTLACLTIFLLMCAHVCMKSSVLFSRWCISQMIKSDSATCCDCQVRYNANMEIASAVSFCWQCSCFLSVYVCVCVLANCISPNVISIQRGSGLSQVLRHSAEGRKNTCQNIFTLSLIAGRPVGCNLTNDF